MNHGRPKGGPFDLLDFETFRKKGCFLSFEWAKANLTTFFPNLEKFWKVPCAPPGKYPSDTHAMIYEKSP